VLPPKYDVFAVADQDDPYPAYATLRAAGALCRAGPGQWAVTRYAEVAALLRDERLAQFQFAEAYELVPESARKLVLPDGPARSFTRRSVVALNRPPHTSVRRLMTKALIPMMSGIPAAVAAMTDRVLDAAAERGQLDAVRELGHPVPYAVLCELLGVPPDDRAEFGAHAADLARAFALAVPDAAAAAADRAVAWLRGYFWERMSRDRPGGPDFLSRMVRHNREVDADLLVDNAIFLMLAGLETSVNLIGGGMLALAQRPDQWARLREDPARVQAAVEELLRFDAPTRMTARLVTAPVEVDGRTLRPGRVVLLLIGSANHDERQFTRPDRLDVTRQPNHHLSFGSGVHHCVGAALARLEAAAVLDRLVRRFTQLEPAGQPLRDASTGLRSYASVPLAVGPR